MSASLIGWIWKESVGKNLSTGARMTLFALTENVSLDEHDNWYTFPRCEFLALLVGCGEETLRYHLKELTEAGLLTQYDGSGRQREHLYWLMADVFGGSKSQGGEEHAS